MSVFNGAVGVHIATIMRKFSKKRQSRTSYLPLTHEDDDETASRKTSATGSSATLVGSSRESLIKEGKEKKEREGRKRIEKVEKPTTAWVLLWILLCKFSGVVLFTEV